MKNNKLFNSKRTKAQRKFLRNNMTQAEIKLWSALKGRQMLGCKFRRQHGIDSYIVDFYCPELKLVIEVDGESHYQKSGILHDKKRGKFLNGLGIRVLRFSNLDILKNLDGVLISIQRAIREIETLSSE